MLVLALQYWTLVISGAKLAIQLIQHHAQLTVCSFFIVKGPAAGALFFIYDVIWGIFRCLAMFLGSL